MLKNVKDVRVFLAIASFYWRLIPKFIDIGKSLTLFTRNDSYFQWEEQQVATFQALKDALCSSDITAYPHFNPRSS
jgi:hypothetical protein